MRPECYFHKIIRSNGHPTYIHKQRAPNLIQQNIILLVRKCPLTPGSGKHEHFKNALYTLHENFRKHIHISRNISQALVNRHTHARTETAAQ